jgi:hypothetical protein
MSVTVMLTWLTWLNRLMAIPPGIGVPASYDIEDRGATAGPEGGFDD